MLLTVARDEIIVNIGSGHRGQSREDRTNWPIILHGGHVVVDLVGGHFAFFVEGDLYIGGINLLAFLRGQLPRCLQGVSARAQAFPCHPLTRCHLEDPETPFRCRRGRVYHDRRGSSPSPAGMRSTRSARPARLSFLSSPRESSSRSKRSISKRRRPSRLPATPSPN